MILNVTCDGEERITLAQARFEVSVLRSPIQATGLHGP